MKALKVLVGVLATFAKVVLLFLGLGIVFYAIVDGKRGDPLLEKWTGWIDALDQYADWAYFWEY